MAIHFFTEDIQFNLPKKRIISSWIKHVISSHQFKVGELSFIFVSNKKILSINKEYLNHDYFTDIITFNYCQNDQLSGDIFISIDTVKENAKEYSVTFENELNRVIIHGVLHLLGFNDSTLEEKEEMRNQENLALTRLNS